MKFWEAEEHDLMARLTYGPITSEEPRGLPKNRRHVTHLRLSDAAGDRLDHLAMSLGISKTEVVNQLLLAAKVSK